MYSLISSPTTSSVFSAYTTFSALSMLVKTVLNDVQNISSQILPAGLQEKILLKLGGVLGTVSPQMTLIIDEYNGHALNQIYESSEAYLPTKITPSVGQLKAFKAPQDTDISLSIDKGEKIVDVFDGIQVTWEMISIDTQKTSSDYDGLFSSGTFYGDTKLDHPSTFDTLALDPTLKKEVIDDLDRFIKRRDYYRRVGKAWKRGYLLYGPPGTGKSSMIAAIANYLKFDIYELELTSIQNNTELKRTLISTANRSILVIEDIDCSIKLNNRQDENYNQDNQKLTLSGLLNFIDGLWSSCGDERIIVFTTNHKDRLDPALLRPGRMDMHIHMSYCTPSAFKILASNYLEINNHDLFFEIEKLITEVEATPAEIAEQLMKSEEADVSLGGLVKFLQDKKIGSSESTAEGGKVEDVIIDGIVTDEKFAKETEKKRVKNTKKNRRSGKKQNRGL